VLCGCLIGLEFKSRSPFLTLKTNVNAWFQISMELLKTLCNFIDFSKFVNPSQVPKIIWKLNVESWFAQSDDPIQSSIHGSSRYFPIVSTIVFPDASYSKYFVKIGEIALNKMHTTGKQEDGLCLAYMKVFHGNRDIKQWVGRGGEDWGVVKGSYAKGKIWLNNGDVGCGSGGIYQGLTSCKEEGKWHMAVVLRKTVRTMGLDQHGKSFVRKMDVPESL
jgi:hypothetical protein